MLKVTKTIVVEGRYDKAKLASVFDANIIETGGFRIFSDPQRLALLRRLASSEGIIVLTDSDRAGFLIRRHITSAVPPQQITHIYIPDVPGKERRKARPSAEGMLGVEGMDAQLLIEAFRQAGVLEGEEQPHAARPITKMDLYELGLSGGQGSAALRSHIKELLDLPGNLGVGDLLRALNRLLSYEQLCQLLNNE